MSSPCQMACGTGAAPRQAGSSEKCRFTHPCGGISSAALRDQRPVRGDRAAVRRERAQPVAGSPASRGEAGLSTSRPASAAHSRDRAGPDPPAPARGGVRPGDDRRDLVPRPQQLVERGHRRLPGCRRTPGASSGRDPYRARHRPRRPRPHLRAPCPTWGAARSSPAGRGSPHHSASRISFIASFAGDRVEPVDEQHAVQVIGLMLDAAGQLTGALQGDRLPVHVEALGHHAVGPLGGEDEAGEGQAALVVGLLLGRQARATG